MSLLPHNRELVLTFVKIFPYAVFIFIAFGLLYQNPFGNNPDIIGDESYFLTSALTAIEHVSLPGWVWSPSTTYYGGVQAYVDTAVLVPVVAVVVAASHFSLTAAKLWVAQNTGELLHVLRLVSGATALAAILFCYLFFRKRKIAVPLARTLALFLFLLLSNVLVIEFLHTAKMWAYYVIFVAVASALFIAQEYYLTHVGRPLLTRERYAALLIWSAILTFFQSYVGAFSILLLVLYALALRHIGLDDIWKHVRKYWYLIILFSLTQISFLFQAYAIRHQFAGVTIKTAAGAIDWTARAWTPLLYTLESQPLSLFYALGVLALIALALYKRSFFAERRRRLYLCVAVAHPIAVYLFFYIGIGFDLLPRYAILLTLACAFSAAILMGELGARWVFGALAASALLFTAINVHAIALYWRPSSETALLQTIEAKYNTPDTVFITDHSAVRMTLPVNNRSLDFLDQKRADMSRFAFLLQHRDLVRTDTTFKPITITAYLDEEKAADVARFSTTTDAVWVISTQCNALCTAEETRSGTCFELNIEACGVQPQEVNTLPVFLTADQLGYSYIVRRVH